MKNKHIGTLKGTVRFAALAVGLLIMLLLLNWLPGTVDKGGMKHYAGVDELRRESGFGAIIVPSYFPESIKWPPTSVLGQKRPFMATIMEFEGNDGRPTLIISESGSPEFRPGRMARFMELRSTCSKCHTTDDVKLFYVGKRAERIFDNLKAEISKGEPNPAMFWKNIGALGKMGCKNCHLTHRAYSIIKERWEEK